MSRILQFEEFTGICDYTVRWLGHIDLEGDEFVRYVNSCNMIFMKECCKYKFKKFESIGAGEGVLLEDYYKVFKNGEKISLPNQGKAKITLSCRAMIGELCKLQFFAKLIVFGENPDEKAEESEPVSTKCIICVENKKKVIFGCKHLCVCASCAQKIDDCPMCRAPIKSCTTVFW